jgi:hypothetical protein
VSFIKRLVYYLGGVGLGIILLMFFLSGKKTSCDYGPNARTLKFLKSKPLIKSDELQRALVSFELDSAKVASVFIQGEVNFRKSKISNELPNIYSVFITFEQQGSFEFRFLVDEKVTELISIQPSDP